MESYELMQATFDLSTEDGQMKLFNARNAASISFKTLQDGQVLEIEDILQYTEKVDTYGADQEAIVTTLFATDGTSYAGVSDTISKAGENLIQYMKQFDKKVVHIRVMKQKSGKGNEFLNLQLTKKPE